LGTRFEIKGFPTIKFLSKGNVYSFKGRRSAADLVKFATGGYADQPEEIIPPPTAWYSEIKQVYAQAWKNAQRDLKNKKYFSIEIFLVVIPFIFIAAMLFIMFLPAASTPESNTSEESKPSDKKKD
jgi:hypothetical protein